MSSSSTYNALFTDQGHRLENIPLVFYIMDFIFNGVIIVSRLFLYTSADVKTLY